MPNRERHHRIISPLLFTGGIAYMLPDSIGLISADMEISNVRTRILRVGAEVPIIREVTLRAGVDRIDLKEKGMGASPGVRLHDRQGISGVEFRQSPMSTSSSHLHLRGCT